MPTVENFWYFLGLTVVIRGELADCEDERVAVHVKTRGSQFLGGFLTDFLPTEDKRGCRFLDTRFLGGCLSGFLLIEVWMGANAEGGTGVSTVKTTTAQ
jgi:hypothetical protein